VIYRTDEDALTREIVALGSEYGRYGYRRITALLRDRGWHVGKDRVQRIWRREGLKVPQKQRPRGRLWLGDGSCLRLRPERANHVWSYDFVSAMTHDGRTLRMLTLIDEYTQECLTIRVARRLGRYEVIEALADVMLYRGILENIRSDNGPELVSKVPDPWAYRNGVKLDFSRPGKRTDNAYVESFNGSLRDECLNVNWFLSLEDARGKIEAWWRHYNESRPHSALEHVPPREFASKGRASPALAGSARPGIFTP
jgi:putative transposase